jgi:hypothetical protein
MRSLLLVLLLLLPLLAQEGVRIPAQWRVELAWQAPVKLSGCVIADVDPVHPGPEIVAVGGDGSVFLVGRQESGWAGSSVFKATGELVQVAAGPIPGLGAAPVIVAVGKAQGAESDRGPGAAYLVRFEDGAWTGRVIASAPQLIHGVCIHEGRLFVTGYDQKLHELVAVGAEWEDRVLGELPGPGKSVIWHAGGLAVACSDGSLLHVTPAGETWSMRLLDKRGAGRGRLGSDGSRLVVSDDDGTLSVIAKDARRELLRGGLRRRGAVIADLDPLLPGLEIATAGYDRAIRIFVPAGEDYEMLTPYLDRERFHHLAAGDLDGDGVPDLAGCTFAGSVVVVQRIAAGG